MMKFALLLTVVLGASACSSNSSVPYSSPHNWEQASFKTAYAKKQTMRSEDFRLNIIRVTDLRIPADRKRDESRSLIHAYVPSELVNNLEDYVKSTVERNLVYPANAPLQLGVEIDVKRFKGVIEHGWFNRYGKYVAEVELQYTVRDKDSRVMMRETVMAKKEESRKPVQGQMPSAARDRSVMQGMFREMVTDLTLDMGWTVRSAFDKQRSRYVPVRTKSAWDSEFEF